MEDYLLTYKRAFVFSKVYELILDFNKTQYKWTENYVEGEKDGNARYVITEKISLR